MVWSNKPLQNIYNTYMFASIAIYGHSDHRTDIAIEFTSKIHSRTYITLICFPVLPYMVILITKWTSPSNSYQKTTLEPVEFSLKTHIRWYLYFTLWLDYIITMIIQFSLKNDTRNLYIQWNYQKWLVCLQH